MSLASNQKGVLRGIVGGAIVTVFALVSMVFANPVSFPPDLPIDLRLAYALKSDVLVGLWIAISVGRLARHRFFTPQDIDGGGLTPGTEQAQILQSTLQNTIEQSLLAVLAHMIWAVTMPLSWLAVVPMATLLFLVGRILFVSGYARGASSRAFGFALTFYPSVLMLLTAAIAIGADLLS